MAAAGGSLQKSEDQFLCSICLEVFTEPVSTPCGHNFCKTCISGHWDSTEQSGCLCPLCKEEFNSRPQLRVNTFVSEMVARFRDSDQWESGEKTSSSEQPAAEPGEVPCDVCTGSKPKALKSCLDCLVSYCAAHLEPHRTVPRMKRHQLIEPVGDLEAMTCPKHNKLLELFCRTDRVCVCLLCPVTEHKSHSVVPLEEGFDEEKAKLGTMGAGIQARIQNTQQKIVEMERSVALSDAAADRQTAKGVQVFTGLIESVERGLSELVNAIEDEREKKKAQAEGFIKELRAEITDLKKSETEVVLLSRCEDRLQLLRSSPRLKVAPPARDWTMVGVRPSDDGIVVNAVTRLKNKLSEEIDQELWDLVPKRVQRMQKLRFPIQN